MAPKNPPTREEQIVWLRHRKRGRLPPRSVRPVRLIQCRIFHSARFRPACRISGEYAGYISGKSPIRRDHRVVSSSSKVLSSQPTSISCRLLREKIRQRWAVQRSEAGVRPSVFSVRTTTTSERDVACRVVGESGRAAFPCCLVRNSDIISKGISCRKSPSQI